MTDHISISRDSGVMRVRFNRPEKKNALNVAMYEALAAAYKEGDADEDIGAILLEGGEDIFTAGNDLKDFAMASAGVGMESPAVQWIKAVAFNDTPLVAAISGGAVGIGSTILLHHDLVYADETAYFHMPFTDLATVPEAGASWILPKRFGRQAAAEFFLASEKISAQRGYDIGFINGVVKDRPVGDHAFEMAKRVAAKPRQAMRKTKALMRGNTDDFLAHIEQEIQMFSDCLQSEEMQKVIAVMMAR